MSTFVLAPDAEEDLFQIWSYLFQKAGLELADRIQGELFDAFSTVATAPGLGHSRTDLTTAPVLFFPVYQYMIVYRAKTPLEIVRVLHGKRDVKRILKDSGVK